jgi:Dolichyl-phosphate-mannose-protein mannosyltransferase
MEWAPGPIRVAGPRQDPRERVAKVQSSVRTETGVRGSALVLAGAVVVAVAALAVTLTAFSHDYDEGVYWQSLLSLDAGNHLYSSVFSSQPPLFLSSLLPIFHLGGPSVVAARVPLVLFALVGLAGVWLLGRRAGTNSGLLAPALVLSVAPFVLSVDRLAATTPSVVLSVVGVAVAGAAARRIGRARLGLALVAGLVLAAATMVKLLGAVAVVPAALFLVVPPTAWPDTGPGPEDSSTGTAGWRSRLPAAAVLLVGVVGGVAVVSALFWSHGDLYDQVVGFHLQARGLRAGPLFNLKVLTFATLTIPALLAAVAASVIVMWRRLRSATIYLVWLVTGGAFLLLQHPLFSPHKLLLVPPAALIVAGLPAWLSQQGVSESFTRWCRIAVGAVVVVGLVGVAYGAVRSERSPGRATSQMIDALRADVPAGTLVVTDDPVVAAAAGRRVPPSLVDTSNVRFEANDLSADDLIRVTDSDAGAVLLTGGRFDQVPAYAAWVEQHFNLIATFPNGAALYTRP